MRFLICDREDVSIVHKSEERTDVSTPVLGKNSHLFSQSF